MPATVSTSEFPAKYRAAIFTLIAGALGATVNGQPLAAPRIDGCVHAFRTELRRCMAEGEWLVDLRTTAAPVLYPLLELPEPETMHTLRAACDVRVEHLPKRIEVPGALAPSAIATSGLLSFPNPYLILGGRCNEQYWWDSYFTSLGLLHDGHLDFTRGMVDNLFLESNLSGNLLNANRTYFMTRSQPPLLSSVVRLVYEVHITATPQAYGEADARRGTAYSYAKRDQALWLGSEHAAGDTGLARYYDSGKGTVPEIANVSPYFPDIIQRLLDHTSTQTTYSVNASDLASRDQLTPEQAVALSRTICDVSTRQAHSELCARAHVGTEWLSREINEENLAIRESGFHNSYAIRVLSTYNCTGWAPTTYFAVAALERAGADQKARTVAQPFLRTVGNGFQTDGTIRDKYNLAANNADVPVSAGYKQNTLGSGSTNGAYPKFQRFLAAPAGYALPPLGLRS